MFRSIVEKGRSLKLLIACSLIVLTSLVIPKIVVAQDFSGNSGLSDIWYLEKMENGNILAIDKKGVAAVFDYLDWTKVNEGLGFDFERFAIDPTNNIIIATKSNKYYTNDRATPYKFDLTSHNWSQAGPMLSPGNTTTCPYFFSRNADLYVLYLVERHDEETTPYIYKLQDGTWSLFSTGPVLPTETDNQYAYDPETGMIVIQYRDSSPNRYRWSVKYSFSSGMWTAPVKEGSYSESVVSVGYKNGVVGGLYNRSSDYTLQFGYLRYAIGEDQQDGRIFCTKDFLSGSYLTGIYLVTSPTATLNIDLGYPLYVACRDQYGNIVFGGKNGKFIVRDKGGVFWTDTSFYSEFTLHNISEDAIAARMAAESAQATSLLVKTDTEYIRNNLFPSLQNEVNTIKNQISTIQTSITNNQSPHIYKVSGFGGATCTTGSTFLVVVQASGATHFRAGTSPGTGNEVEIGSPCSVTLDFGANTIYVEAWDESNPTKVATGQMAVFRLN